MKIKLEEIEIRNRKRNLNPDKVTELASSFSLLGQLQPISVINKNHGFELLAGWHRIEAARLLGWSEIDANIFEGDELECELVEIDENLIHNSLTVLEQGEQLQRRNQILEEMGLRAKRGDNQYSGGPEMISGPKTTADIGKLASITVVYPQGSPLLRLLNGLPLPMAMVYQSRSCASRIISAKTAKSSTPRCSTVGTC